MNIERKRKWQLGVALAVMVGGTTWLAAVPGPGTGHSFTPTSLASPFTQDLYATTGNVQPGSVLGGVAFAPDGRVWSAECNFLGTRLHRFAGTTTAINGSSVHEEELVVDLTASGPLGIAAGGCGLVNHPDGSIYASSTAGIWQLDATTGQVIAGPFGHGSNALGIAVDPQAAHHLVYVGDDCHPSLDPDGSTCTLWDLDPVTHVSLVFARLTRPEFMLIDGLYFDPSGNFVFAAHRQVDFDDNGFRTDHNSLQILARPTALQPATAPINDLQSLGLVPMVSEPDGVAFHAGDGFVVTLNESLDCVDSTSHVVASDPNLGGCGAGTTPIGGTMTRFDFANGYAQPPSAVRAFATGGFRGDLAQVGADGCIYATQAPLFSSGGTVGTRYDNDVTTSDNSLVQICGNFVTPPGVSPPASGPGQIAGLVFLDANHNGVRDSGEGGLAAVPVTLSTDPTHPQISAADGTFLFESLAAGTYTVTTPATAAYLAGSLVRSTAGSSGAIVLAAGETKAGYEFGYAPGSLAGTVFQDLNHNTVRDAGEPPLGGVQVTLAGAAGGTAISAANGSYHFNLLASGAYTVTVPGTAGVLVLTTVGSRAVALAPGEDKTDIDFGYAPPLTIACLSPATGQVGVPYSGSAVASGGVAPYTYAIVGTLPAGLSLNASTGQISGTPTATGSFTVTVTDANGAGASTATSACSVTIAPAPLTIVCVSPATGQVGVAYSGSAVASGGVAPYTYAIVGTLPAGLALNAATGQISGTPTATGSFTVKVTDANGAGASTATSACSVTIAPAPLTIACVSPATGQVGVAYSGSAVASGGVAPYTYAIVGTLPAGLALNASTGQISGTPTATGSFTVKVTDANGAGASTATSACSVTIAPAPLTIACVSPATGQVGVAYSGSAVASGGVMPYTYAIVGTLPAGLALNAATGQISGTPTATGSFTVKVTDANGAGASTATSACSVTIAPAPLTISCVSLATGQVGVAYSGSAVASGGVAPYTYAIVGTLPAGLALNASTGQISGTPTATGSFTVKVTDANGAGASTATSACSVTIAPAPLTIACVSPATGQVGVAYSGSAVASGGVMPYTYAIVGTLPAGLALNAATGQISGTPTATGSFTVKVTDANGAGASTATSACSVTIAPAPLTISCVSPATGQVGVAYSGSAVASGGVAPYTYAIVGTLPAGLALNASTGQISGTPTATGSFTVKVTDANGAGASTATSACSVTIAPAPLTIACVSPATGQVGVAYSGSAVASGGVMPYTYAIVGTLPAGLALNASTGQISGTPTATGSFTVKVTDANGAGASTATSACSVTIAPAPLTIACVSPATGQVGVAYSGSAVASGGVMPYTYAIVGTLPAGLALNAATGQISGTPTATGSFTVKVTDANGAGASTATSACSVTIAPAPLTIACVSPATGQVGVAYSGSAVASGGVAPYTYAIVGTLPAGLALNASTGQISGTPTATGSFTVKVTDANGAGASTATSACSVTIAPAPLTIACVSPATGQVGVAYSGSAVASGGVMPYTYAIVGTLPAGLALNASTGQISGTPTATGSFTVKVTDANGAGASTATSACSVTIAPAPLTIACVSPATGQVGVAYSGSAVASGGVAPYTYAIVGTLPAGLALNASTGQISGTPTATGSFTVKVTDANGAGASTATSACSVTIAPAPPAAPTLFCAAATTGQVGVAYTSNLVAMGGVGGYTFSIAVGSLPTGLTLDASTGAITGTPTAAGSFPFTAKVVDGRGTIAGTTTNSCGITIATGAAAYTTYTQGGWGAPPNGNNPGMLLRNNFAVVYPNGVTIGGSPYSLKFTSQSAIEAFLPAGGKPGVLTKTAINPTSSSANVFAGQVLALRLSVDFSNAGIITGGLPVLKVASGNPLAGWTVAQVLALANQVIAGNTSALPAGQSVSSLNDLVSRINQNYDGGTTNNGVLVP